MNQIVIHEVGMRDGLQMEHQNVPFEVKAKWVERLLDSGVDIVQLGSFVNPTKVPQMADSDKLFEYFSAPKRKRSLTMLAGLVLNDKGLDRGLACGVDMFCMGVSASETHSRKNTGMSVAEATKTIIAMARRALETNKKIQVSVQSAFGCGYEGHVPRRKVMNIVGQFLDAGLKNISLADTAGHAVPEQVTRMFEDIFKLDPTVECTCHFHDTYGLGLANCRAAMGVGVKYFESSVAGLGGCPFTKIAGGNVCTEDFVHYLQRIGQRKDIQLDKLIEVAVDVARFFDRQMPGKVYRTGAIPFEAEGTPLD